ncbi:hypothetical protein LEN26_010799 [Aphanomyces euteiches]|nr:hypothetical protein LEN26_010799 [Aphanomyces euteiches]
MSTAGPPLHRARTAESTSPKDELDALRAVCAEQKRQLAHHEATIESFRRDLRQAERPKANDANYQALAIEKERLVELVKSLQQQLDKKQDKPDTRSRLPRLNQEPPSGEIERLKRAIEAKDEEIATWKEAYERASMSTEPSNSRLVAELEAENELLRSRLESLQGRKPK